MQEGHDSRQIANPLAQGHPLHGLVPVLTHLYP
jgi:hypothetical protein